MGSSSNTDLYPKDQIVDEKAEVAYVDYTVDEEKGDLDTTTDTSTISHNDIDHGYSQEFIKRTTRKIDWRLIPPLIAMYCISSIDRKNVSLARAANKEAMQTELQLGTDRYSIITLLFFPAYIIFELPVSKNAINTRTMYLPLTPRSRSSVSADSDLDTGCLLPCFSGGELNSVKTVLTRRIVTICIGLVTTWGQMAALRA
jgi:hypothetical protein